MNQETIAFIRQRGLLLEKDLFDLLTSFSDAEIAKNLLNNLEKVSGQKMITSSSLTKNAEYVLNVVKSLPGEMKQQVETVFIKMGITVEIQKSTSVAPISQDKKENLPFQIYYTDTKNHKKIEIADFVGHFRSRYQQLQRILMQRGDLQNLVSLNKIAGDRQRFSFIGIVTDKRTTPNKNIIITFEDLTGSVKALIKQNADCFSKASELQLDDVVLVKGSGNREIVFVHDIVFPDSFKEKVRFDEDYSIAFVSDVHVGSQKHLGTEFQRFLDWLNSGNELAKSIRYIFFVGDNVDGVGVFPGQERLLNLKSLKEQYAKLASYIKQVPSHITMFMCPGQHDSVRVAEPQPMIDSFYGEALYAFPNLFLVSNPSMIKLTEGDKEFKVLMYHGASIHAFINEIDELRAAKAHRCPARAVKHMLKRRHLAPTHGVSPSIVYVPNAQHDPLVISEVPDVLCTGEVHRLDIENYNGTIIITGSCWQAQTEFEEKVGNVPDPCKVPLFNVKTRELKVLDFTQ